MAFIATILRVHLIYLIFFSQAERLSFKPRLFAAYYFACVYNFDRKYKSFSPSFWIKLFKYLYNMIKVIYVILSRKVAMKAIAINDLFAKWNSERLDHRLVENHSVLLLYLEIHVCWQFTISYSDEITLFIFGCLSIVCLRDSNSPISLTHWTQFDYILIKFYNEFFLSLRKFFY